MKTLLIPTLTLALSCLPARAQDIAAPGALPPATPAAADRSVEGNVASRAGKTPDQIEDVDKARVKMVDELTKSPLLPNPVRIEGTRLSDLIEDLNARLTKLGATPLNVVAEPELESYPIPAMTLQNVSATDVLNVVAKITGLKLEPVPSDSGKVAAWIVTRRKPSGSLAGMMGSFAGGGGGGGESAPGSGAFEGFATPAPGALPPVAIETAPSAAPASGLPPGTPGSFIGAAGSALVGGGGPVALGGGGNVTWEDPASGGAPRLTVSRVLGIAKIFEDIANPEERAKAEDQLVRTLDKLAPEQKLECNVRLYAELQVIVVKGTADGVALIEQTVTALKENADTKKPSSVGNKFSSGIGIKQ